MKARSTTKVSTVGTFSNRMRRPRPEYKKDSLPKAMYIKGKLRFPPNPVGKNHDERRKDKASERLMSSYQKQARIRRSETNDKEMRKNALKTKRQVALAKRIVKEALIHPEKFKDREGKSQLIQAKAIMIQLEIEAKKKKPFISKRSQKKNAKSSN